MVTASAFSKARSRLYADVFDSLNTELLRRVDESLPDQPLWLKWIVLDDGTPVHSFSTLLSELSTVVRSTCRTPNAGAGAPTFAVVTTANPYQRRALDLIHQIAQ